MSSTVTLVIPRAEKESAFLQLAVQAAIRAYRDVYKTHEVKTDNVNDGCREASRLLYNASSFAKLELNHVKNL